MILSRGLEVSLFKNMYRKIIAYNQHILCTSAAGPGTAPSAGSGSVDTATKKNEIN